MEGRRAPAGADMPRRWWKNRDCCMDTTPYSGLDVWVRSFGLLGSVPGDLIEGREPACKKMDF